jgi:hypothetical protein
LSKDAIASAARFVVGRLLRLLDEQTAPRDVRTFVDDVFGDVAFVVDSIDGGHNILAICVG